MRHVTRRRTASPAGRSATWLSLLLSMAAGQVEKDVQERIFRFFSRSFISPSHYGARAHLLHHICRRFSIGRYSCGRRSRGGQFKRTAQRCLFELNLMFTRITSSFVEATLSLLVLQDILVPTLWQFAAVRAMKILDLLEERQELDCSRPWPAAAFPLPFLCWRHGL